ncbi:MAG: glycoside hydrolase family 20 zincin-like fold domain-containing protein [Victivallaceae bacterium]|nr:glycoside hydrolase family 20 zincin-like fold domain-containing protein [Victivallaceae bacterium]
MKKLLLIFFAAFGVLASEPGDLRLEAAKSGFVLRDEFTDVSIFSRVVVCDPSWKPIYFSTGESASYENSGAGAAIAVGGSGEAICKKYSMNVDGNSGRVELEVEMVKDVPALLEYTVFTVPIDLLSGAEFTARTADGQTVSGRIPFTGPQSDITNYVKDAVEFEADAPLGRFHFKAEKGPGFTVADRRATPFEFMRCFWIGANADLGKGEVFVSSVTFGFEPKPGLKFASPLPSNPTGVKIEAPRQSVPRQLNLPLLPQPRKISMPGGVCRLSGNFTVTGVSPEDAARLRKAADRLFPDGCPARIAVDANADLPDEDGYTLSIADGRAAVSARTARGAYYALHTLRALRRTNGEYPVAEIRDWPELKLRGIQAAQLDEHSLQHYTEVIENVMGPMKMNFLLLECEFVGWDATKGVHASNAMPKQDFLKLLEVARDNFIETAPLIQTLSHAPWLFVGKQNLDLAEDPEYPYAFFTSNPRLYPLLEKLFDEVTAAFGHPRYFHAGTDELYLFGRFPNRPETVEKGSQKVVYDFVMWVYDYCKKHDMQLMLWQDIFATHDESPENGAGGQPHNTWELRDKLPKDIIFTVWRYSGNYDKFGDLDALSAAGFPVIGASWYAPGNPEKLTREAIKLNAVGMLSTTWVYTSHDQSARPVDMVPGEWIAPPDAAFYYWFYQLAAYVRSGCMAWNPDAGTDFDSSKIFCDLYEFAKPATVKTVRPLDLSAAANLEISPENNPFLLGGTFGFEAIPEIVGDIPFKPMESNGRRAAIAVKSRLTPNFPETVPVFRGNFKAGRLYFLNTVIGSEPKKYDPAATAVITYADGSKAEFPLRFEYEVGTPLTEYNRYLSTGNCAVIDSARGESRIWYSTWNNPHPEKDITGIDLKCEKNAYFLFGITAEP